MRIRTGVRLADHTTLRLGGPATRFVEADTETDVVEAVRDADAAADPVLVLGGGSNLVVGDAGFAGTVVHVRHRWVAADLGGGDRVRLTVAAGNPWDAVVEHAVGHGLAGLECLSGIPGFAGASPVQNVGAYGQEVADTITALRVLDRRSGTVGSLTPAECGFGYRTSIFKHTARFVVLAVTFDLFRSATSRAVRYPELARALGVEPGGTAPLPDVRDAVLALRRGKGMVWDEGDPDSWSAGSFFTNPVVPPAVADRLPADAPRFPQPEGSVKLSAAWLLQAAGVERGSAVGRARVSTKHTLALTNPGGATTEELLQLARTARRTVLDAFGIELVPEPVLVGCEL